MENRIISSWLGHFLVLLLLTFTLSGNTFAESIQEAMIGQQISEEEKEESKEEQKEKEAVESSVIIEEEIPLTVKEEKVEAAPKKEAKPKEEKPKAVTLDDLSIPQDELKLLLKPFSTDELKIEADAWFKALQAKATEVVSFELKTTRLNKKQITIEENLEILMPSSEGKNTKVEEKDPNDPRNLSTEKRLEYVQKILSKLDPSLNSDALESKSDVQNILKKMNATLDDEKEKLTSKTGELIEQRSSLVDRLNIVLNSINDTDGIKEDGTDNDAVVPLRRYIATVTGLNVDTNDLSSTAKTIKKWLFSRKGGKRWVKNIALFVGTLFGFWILSLILSAIVNKMIKVSGNTSELLHHFLVGLVKKVTMLVGVIMSLSALEINISPLLAALGAAGFILAFALQGTISNFASGLLMLLYRPFDVGDSIEGGGAKGIVESMSLVSTYIKTPDNQHIVVPNNAIWGGSITNSSRASTRRVDLSFTTDHKDNADDVIKLLKNVVKGQSLVLAEPAFSVSLDELTESGVNFSVQSWVNKADYSTVKSAITHDVKCLFDNGKIHMPGE